MSSYSSTDSPEGQDIQNLLNINPLHSQLNKKVGTHSHAMLVLNKVRQFIVIFLIMVLIGEKSGPIYFAITKSTNVYAALFYGCVFYRLCLSFAHVEISTSYCLFKKLHETKKRNNFKHSDSKWKRNVPIDVKVSFRPPGNEVVHPSSTFLMGKFGWMVIVNISQGGLSSDSLEW